MDVYCTIDSPDIRSYLQEIRYQFTIEEAAYLVWQCRRVTLEEKFAAWEEIVDTMPDSAIIGRPFGGRERVDKRPPISPGLHSVSKAASGGVFTAGPMGVHRPVLPREIRTVV